MKILVSACLLGARCRYDGGEKANERVLALANAHTLIPVCPEQLGGLPTPRPPAERQGERVVTAAGADVAEQYRRGALETLRLCRVTGASCAVLKAHSPSCGRGTVYDGTFSGRLTAGDGVTAALFLENGVPVYSEDNLPK